MKYCSAKLVSRLGACALCLWFLGGFCSAGPAAEAEPAETLVKRLGDPECVQRDQAEAELLRRSEPVLDALRSGLKSADPETRRRCQRILARRIPAELSRISQAFAAQPDSIPAESLPGWKRFKATVGEAPADRQLYAELLREEPGLMCGLDGSKTDLRSAFEARLLMISSQANNPQVPARKPATLFNAAALLLAASQPDLELEDNWVNNLRSYVLANELRSAVNDGPRKEPLRRLLVAWVTMPTTNPNLRNVKLTDAIAFQIKEALPVPVAQLQSDKTPPHERGQALEAVARIGGREYAALLVPYLNDETVVQTVGTAQGQFAVQVRDVALAFLVHLTGQDPGQYGMPEAAQWFNVLKQNPQLVFNQHQYRQADESKRPAGIAKFREWLKANPLPAAPDVPKANPPGAPAQAKAVVRQAAPQTTDTLPGGLEPADRDLLVLFKRARERVRGGEESEAAQILGDLAALERDYWFLPDAETPTYRLVRSEAERWLGNLQKAGREAYELQFGSAANALFNNALKAQNPAELESLAKRYFHTRAGNEAAFLMASLQYARGQIATATLQFDRLRRTGWYAAKFEPQLSLQLAVCLLREGRRDEQAKVLADLQQRLPDAKIELGGKLTRVFDAAGQVEPGLLAAVDPGRTAVSGWLLQRGTQDRNPPGNAVAPALPGKQLAPASADAVTVQTLEKTRTDSVSRRLAVLPVCEPLAVDRTLIFRTATELNAVDLDTGVSRWHSPLDDALWLFEQMASPEDKRSLADPLARALKRRLQEDQNYGSLASDGHLVFAIEDHSQLPLGNSQPLRLNEDGKAQLDTRWLSRENRLAAFDLKSGKLIWQAVPIVRSEVAREPLVPGQTRFLDSSGDYFLGPPLPLGARLYVLAHVGEETRLQELDAQTGTRRREWLLSLSEGRPQVFFQPQAYLNRPAPPGGLSPAYADGLLICPTAEKLVVAVDLTLDMIRWAWDANSLTSSAPAVGPLMIMPQPVPTVATDAWFDSGLMLAKGCAFFSPLGADQFVCLDLSSGTVRWTAPRRDGLYLAAVAQERLLVVGRSSIRAWNIGRGELAWQRELTLDERAVPSGRGYLGEAGYHLPLGTGEVLVVDVLTGSIRSRSRAGDGIVPGNLVPAAGAVASQSTLGVWRFPSLAQRQAELAAQLAATPENAERRLDQGALLIAQGQPGAAVDLLQPLVTGEAAPRAKQLLRQALADGLEQDPPRFAALFTSLTDKLGTPAELLSLRQRLIVAWRQQGQAAAAFDELLKCADAAPDRRQYLVDTAACRMRLDAWLQGHLAALWREAPPIQREAFDRLIEQRLRDDRLEAFLTWFGWHPLAARARLLLAKQLADKSDWYAADLLLLRVCDTGTAAEQAAASARRAAVLTAAKRLEEAAACYRLLLREFPEAACEEGRTGRQLVAAIAPDSPLRPWLTGASPWKSGEPKLEVDRTQGQLYGMNPPGRNLEDPRFALGRHLQWDPQNTTYRELDAFGRVRWQMKLSDGNVGAGNEDSASIGPYWFSWANNVVMALDTVRGGDKPLWRKTYDMNVAGRLQFHQRRRFQLRQQAMFGKQQVPGSCSLPLAFVATSDRVCMEWDRSLMCVELATGETIWERDDLAADYDLIGDDEFIFVTPAGTTNATVLSSLDGREVGQRTVPELRDRIFVHGRRVVTWQSGAERTRIIAQDVWTQKILWEREVESKAFAAITPLGEIVVLTAAGRVSVIDARGGSVRVLAAVDPQPELESIYVLSSPERYYLFANRPVKDDPVGVARQVNQGQQFVNGRLFALARDDGRTLWAVDLLNQTLRLDMPPGLPVLPFVRTYQVFKALPQGGFSGGGQKCHWTALQAATGKVLFDETNDQGEWYIETKAVLQEQRLSVRGHKLGLKFTWP